MLAAGGLHGMPAVVAQDHQLHVLESHVGAGPIGPVVRRRQTALGRSRGLERQRRREVRLADESRSHPRLAQGSGDAGLADPGIEVYPVVVHAMGVRQQPREDRGARRLADVVRRDAGGKPGALPRHDVQVRRLDLAAFEAEAVTALLVRCDEYDVANRIHERSRPWVFSSLRQPGPHVRIVTTGIEPSSRDVSPRRFERGPP